jgi:hypothetical protein
MENAQLLARTLRPLVSDILDFLLKSSREDENNSRVVALVRDLLKALGDFTPGDIDQIRKTYAGYFPTVAGR